MLEDLKPELKDQFYIMFHHDKFKYVNFFYKIPEPKRMEYTFFYNQMMSEEDFKFVTSKTYIDYCMYDLSVDKFEWIRKHTDDRDYFTFYEYYMILQPVIETIINANDLLNEFPEYTI